MKHFKLFFLTGVALVSLIVSGCHRIHSEIVGSGKRQIEKRSISGFTSISTEGAFDIDVNAQMPASLEIEGDDNVLPLITTEVSHNILYIKNNHGYSVGEPIKVRVSVPNLEGVSVSGAGKLSITGLKNDKFEIDANGAPTINVAGETGVVNIETKGAAKIDTHKLRAGHAVIDSKGVSNVEVYANDVLDVTVTGPSHIVYQGNATVNQKIYGPGSVEKKQSGPS